MEEKKIKQTWRQKLLFYITAFFVLLGIFSVFSFLFLVPFVIDPAFTTIFMEFDEEPVLCVTRKTERKLGVSNCSWASCREGCTKEIYDCTQIHVDYKKVGLNYNFTPTTAEPTEVYDDRKKRSIKDTRNYDYYFENNGQFVTEPSPTGLMGNDSEWYYIGAKLFPNVKGCGYPPSLNCTIFLKKYKGIGTNFSCYYSRVDPSLVISHLDMWQVYMNLVYAMAIPIPSFILSIIYLTFAYFKIYNDDEEKEPLEKNAEGLDVEEEEDDDEELEGAEGAEDDSVQDFVAISLHNKTTSVCTNTNASGSVSVSVSASGALTPVSDAFREDLASFGHQLKVAMVDEMSRDSFNEATVNSNSFFGNLGKEMTTSISSSGGPVHDI